MKSSIVGIDIGTGSVKAVALDAEGKTIATTQISYPSFSPQNGYHEQDAYQIWEAFIICVKEVISKLGDHPIAISLSSAMHSLILVDEVGNAIEPMITWADARSSDIAEKLREQPIGEKLYLQTGTPIYSMSPVSNWII